MKFLILFLQILFLFACSPSWITKVPPPTDQYQYIVGISEFRASEKKARNEALHHANLQFAQLCGVNVVVISKYFEEYGKKNKLEYETLNHMNNTHNSVNVHVYSIKATNWYIIQNVEKSDLKWKAYVLTTIPTGEEEKIRKYQKEMEQKCSNFLINPSYITARGKSFDTADLAHKDAIDVYNKIIEQETNRKYGINFNLINNKSMSCSEGNRLYYILGIEANRLESEAKHKILAKVSKTNHHEGLKILQRNERLFLSNFDEYKIRYEELLTNLKYVNEYMKKIEDDYRKILNLEKEHDYDKSYLIIEQIEFLSNKYLKYFSENDKKIIEQIKYHKDKNRELKIIVKKLQSLKKDLFKLKRMQELEKKEFFKIFSEIIDKYTPSNNNYNFLNIRKNNSLLLEFIEKYNEIQNIFENNINEFFLNVENLLFNFEPIKNHDIIHQLQVELFFYKNNISLLKNKKVKYYELFKKLNELESKISKQRRLQKQLIKGCFKYIPPGEMLMGNISEDSPLHIVKITRPFYVCDHEVTVEEYQKFFNSTNINTSNLKCNQRNSVRNFRNCDDSNPSTIYSLINNCSLSNWSIKNGIMVIKEGRTNHPMNCVSWEDAISYINWLNTKEMIGNNYYYHLCTEAQWEYAARGNKCKKIIEWTSHSLNYTCESYVKHENTAFVCGSIRDNCLSKTTCYNRLCEGTCEIRGKNENAWGIYDMNGSVAEWVQDKWYSFRRKYIETYTDSETRNIGNDSFHITIDPVGDKNIEDDSRRIHKGGSYWSFTDNMKVSTRKSEKKYYRSTSIGFRICVSKKNKGGFYGK